MIVRICSKQLDRNGGCKDGNGQLVSLSKEGFWYETASAIVPQKFEKDQAKLTLVSRDKKSTVKACQAITSRD